jgi:hypothetical protein
MEKKKETEGLDASFIISQAKSRNRPLTPYSRLPEEERKDDEKEKPEEAEQPERSAVRESPSDTPREETRKRKSRGQDYEALFFKETAVKTRSGKVVYIRKEFHDRILKIVRVIGENELSLFSYLDNVLEHHFNTFQDDITELYDRKNTNVF